jgi:Icc-related predicted phosphoesterase
MKIHVLSDLHLEFGPAIVPTTDADVVVIAGDIDVGIRGLEWLQANFRRQPVIYVLGNHEFYHHDLVQLRRSIDQLAEGSNLGVLENAAVEIGGYSFLGCTLWTDFALRGDVERAMANAEELMNDFRIISNGGMMHRLQARDVAQLHSESVAWLRDELPRHDPAKTVVVTHHAPSPQCEASFHVGGPLSPAFVADLDKLIEPSGVPLWIHGHTHHNVDFRLGNTRVLSNQRGYPAENCPRFDPALVVEV